MIWQFCLMAKSFHSFLYVTFPINVTPVLQWAHIYLVHLPPFLTILHSMYNMWPLYADLHPDLLSTSGRARRYPWKKVEKNILKKKKFEKKIEFSLAYINTPGHPWVSAKNFSPIGPAVWPIIRNIYIQVCTPLPPSFTTQAITHDPCMQTCIVRLLPYTLVSTPPLLHHLRDKTWPLYADLHPDLLNIVLYLLYILVYKHTLVFPLT